MTHFLSTASLYQLGSLLIKKYSWLSICLIFFTADSMARIKLITLPVREQVQVQLDHENITIVEEERIVPLKKGLNDVDFSWHNTSIQSETIVFRLMDKNNPIKPKIISVSYPPNEAALTWKVSALDNGSAKFRISYAIQQLTKKYHYIAYSNIEESQMQLQQWLRIKNSSGESFGQAIVSTRDDQKVRLPLGINESKEIKNALYQSVPIRKSYTVNAAELGYRNRSQDKLNVLMHYGLENTPKNGLGKQPLEAGKIRIYQQEASGAAVFVGEDWADYLSIGGETKLYIGEARDIVVKRTIDSKKREKVGGNLFHIDTIVKYEIENFKDQSVVLTLQESLPHLRNEVLNRLGYRPQNRSIEWRMGADYLIDGELNNERTNAEQLSYQIKLPARKENQPVAKLIQKLNIVYRNEW